MSLLPHYRDCYQCLYRSDDRNLGCNARIIGQENKKSLLPMPSCWVIVVYLYLVWVFGVKYSCFAGWSSRRISHSNSDGTATVQLDKYMTIWYIGAVFNCPMMINGVLRASGDAKNNECHDVGNRKCYRSTVDLWLGRVVDGFQIEGVLMLPLFQEQSAWFMRV